MYHILAGKQRALQFPVMCNACVKIGYSDNIPDTGNNTNTTDDIAYGLWAHTGSFTFEAIITPYDINGFGNYSERTVSSNPPMPRRLKEGTGLNGHETQGIGSQKILPAADKRLMDISIGPPNNHDTQSEYYLSTDNRITHEMRIFHNDNLKISLVNNTFHNQNNPARYKVKVEMTIGTITETILTDDLILPVFSHSFYYDANDGIETTHGLNKEGKIEYHRLGQAVSGSASSNTVMLGFTPDMLFQRGNGNQGTGQEVYVRNGQDYQLLGKVNIKNNFLSQLTLDANLTRDIIPNEDIFIKAYGEPTYINKVFAIGVAFNNTNKTIDIYLDGIKIKTHKHTDTGTFSFSRTDCFLGANGTNKRGEESAITNNQFMGEFHELSIVDYYKTNLLSVPNLMPRLENALLYFRFEEIDE